MYYLILILLAFVLVLLFLRMLILTDVTKLAKHVRYGGAVLAFLGGAFLGLTGRVALAVPLIFIGFAILGKSSPFGWPGSRKSAQQNSRVRTSLIEMMLDHDSGQMKGRVLAGTFEGQDLDDLSLEDLAEIYETARTTGDQSIDLLESYLDRAHADWATHEAFAGQAGKSRARATQSGPMSRDEAYEVLGVKQGADEKIIAQAHKKLMMKLHPDQGGSDYLAAKLNEAKDILLKR